MDKRLMVRNRRACASQVCKSSYVYKVWIVCLSTANGATGPSGSKSYTYDKNGNRKMTVLNASTTNYNYTPGTNRLESTTGAEAATYTYDGDGNITGDSSHAYSFGDHNRLSNVDTGTTAQYKYDFTNLRVKKTLPSGTTLYFYDRSGLLISEKDTTTAQFKDYIYLESESIARIDGNGVLSDIGNMARGSKNGINVRLDWTLYPGSESFVVQRSTSAQFTSYSTLTNPAISLRVFDDPVLADGINYYYRILKTTPNDTLYLYHCDHLGTPIVMTGTSGTVVWRSEYLPFGKIYSQSGSASNNIRLPGQYYDAESTLHYNWARYYDARIGRFVSEDPLNLQDGVTRYAYVLSNPINFKDPEGEQAVGTVPGTQAPACGGPCPHWVFTEYFNLCNNIGTITDASVRRCVKKKCQPKAYQITCLKGPDYPCNLGPNAEAYTPTRDSSVFCPSNFPPPCPRRVIVHEMLHACRRGGPDVRHGAGPSEQQIRRIVQQHVPCP